MAKTKHGTIEAGYWLAAVVRDGTAPLRCYVGQVQAVDERGIRMTLVDWLVGAACGWDFFVTWQNLETALIGTPDHSGDFIEAAAKWQSKILRPHDGDK